MRRSLVALFVIITPGVAFAAPQPAATAATGATGEEDAAPSLRETRDFIFQKLAYDEEYFGRLERYRRQGRRDPGMSAATFQKEVARARVNLPVLRRFSQQKQAHVEEGKPFTLPAAGPRFREYRNLVALLNMFRAHQLGRAGEVAKLGESLKVRRAEDFGAVRGEAAAYYVAMYRAYFYLLGSAHYALGDDKRAVAWFARLEADGDLAKLKDDIARAEVDPALVEALRIESLRRRPLALMPFDNLTNDPSQAWVSSALLEVLSTDLTRHTDLQVVERAQLDKVLEETALSLGGFVEPGRAAQAGQLAGAGTLLVGAYRKQGDGLALTLRLVDTEKEKVLGAGEALASEEELFARARALVIEVLDQVGWADSLFEEELLSSHAPSAATARALHEARLLRSTRKDEARVLFAKAIQEDPASANLYEDLKGEFADVSATVAVLPFTNVSGRVEDDWLPRGAVEALMTDLPRLDFSVVERGRLEEVLLERMERESALLETGEGKALGAALGADFVVMGGVLRHDKSLRVDARFVDVRTGLVVFAASGENRRDDLGAALVALTAAVAERFNRPLDDKGVEQLLSAKLAPEDFERLAREQLAKDALSRAAHKERASAAGAGEGLDLGALAFWGASGGLGVGAALAVTGVVLAAVPASRAHQLQGVHSVVSSETTRASLREQRDQAALEANVWTGVAWAGGALAAASAAWLVGQGVLAALDEGAREEGR